MPRWEAEEELKDCLGLFFRTVAVLIGLRLLEDNNM